jgi:hypothetical protein
MIRFPSFLRTCILALPLAYGFAFGQSATSTDQTSDRQHLQQLQDRAAALQTAEKENPGDDIHKQRIRAFAEVALAIRTYASKYTNPSDLKRLLLIYRGAVNLELAEEMIVAKSELESCEAHPLYHSIDATYDNRRIDVLVPERLQAVKAILDQPSNSPIFLTPTPNGPYVYTDVRGIIDPSKSLPRNSIPVHPGPHSGITLPDYSHEWIPKSLQDTAEPKPDKGKIGGFAPRP